MGNVAECCSRSVPPTKTTSSLQTELPLSLAEQTHEVRNLKLSDFKSVRCLGKGAFGKVIQVHLQNQKRNYAMKVLQRQKLQREKLLDNVILERNILLEYRHPFIVKLKYSFSNSKFIYMVMDYVEGGELYFYLRQEIRFPEVCAKFIFAQVMLAIAFLQSKSIIYRDLKPQNVLVCPDGYIKLTDFGLSKHISHQEVSSTVAGTAEYMAPEMINGKGYGKEIDLWQLGIFLYQLINGQPPFNDISMSRCHQRIHDMIISGKYSFNQYFSENAKSLIRALLNPKPQARIGSKSFEEIKSHPFCSDINWQALLHKQLTSPFISIVRKHIDKRKAKGLYLPDVGSNVTDNHGVEGFQYIDPNGQTLVQKNF